MTDPTTAQISFNEAMCENDRLRETIDALVKALQDLTNEVEGCWRAFDPAIRAAICNANYTVIQEKMDKAKRVLGDVGRTEQ